MFVTQESVKTALWMQIPGVCRSQGTFSYFFVINGQVGGHFACIFILFLLEAKCLILDSNLIAHTLRKKTLIWDIFPKHTLFALIIDLHLGRHLGYIEMLNDARVASLGFFKDNICTTRINKEKMFKIKFQVLLKFAKILLDEIKVLKVLK